MRPAVTAVVVGIQAGRVAFIVLGLVGLFGAGRHPRYPPPIGRIGEEGDSPRDSGCDPAWLGAQRFK